MLTFGGSQAKEMSFLTELKRRNVVRVGIAYVVVGWVLAQAAGLAFDAFGAPGWALKSVLFVLVLGLPLALFFAWAYEITPEGVKREKDVDRSQSITTQTGRKLDFIIIGVLVVAVGFLLLDKFHLTGATPSSDEVVATERQSIAVLPFANMSDDNDNFADGLSEELMNLLAQNPDLRVIGRTSAFAFKGRNEDLREVGETLGVEFILEGSVRRSGDQLRVTAQLNGVEDGSHLWSDNFDRQMADIFRIQDDVAGAIATALEIKLMPASKRPTDNLEAYALYLEAIAQSEISGSSHLPAIDLLDQAIALDPSFAKAWELRAMAAWFTGPNGMDSRDAQVQVYESAVKALELDSTLTLARAFKASAKPGGLPWAEYMDVFEEALNAEPENLRLLFIFYWDLMYNGYFEEALQLARRRHALEPLSGDALNSVGEALRANGRREEARRTFRESANHGNEYGLFNIAWDHFHAGEYESAIVAEEKAIAASGGDPAGFREIMESITESASGKANLDAYVSDLVDATTNPVWKINAHNWYMVFGYVDEFWEIIDTYRSDTRGPWKWGYELRYDGNVWAGSEFRTHPKYITQEFIDLWDHRGPPDFCNKDSGEWVCE